MDSPTTPEAVPQTTPKHSNRLAWILLAIVSILGSGIGGFFLGKQITRPLATPVPMTVSPTPTPDPTSNWKSYSGTNYSFKYPGSFEIVSETPELLVLGAKYTLDAKELTPFLYISSNPATFVKTEYNSPNTSLDGVKVLEMSQLNNPGDEYKIIQTFGSPRIEIKMFVAGAGLSQTFDQILSTFKFEKSNVVINTLREIKDLEPSLNWSAGAKETFKYPLEGKMYIYGTKMVSYPTSKDQVAQITNYLAKNWTQDKTNSVTSLDTDLGTYTKTIEGEKLLLMYEYTGRDFWVMITNEF